jgi:hypothetical protein
MLNESKLRVQIEEISKSYKRSPAWRKRFTVLIFFGYLKKINLKKAWLFRALRALTQTLFINPPNPKCRKRNHIISLPALFVSNDKKLNCIKVCRSCFIIQVSCVTVHVNTLKRTRFILYGARVDRACSPPSEHEFVK